MRTPLLLLAPTVLLSSALASYTQQTAALDAETPSATMGWIETSALLPQGSVYMPDHLKEFIAQENQKHMAEHSPGEHDLGARQGVALGGGVAPGAVIPPTQFPSVTNYQLSGKMIPYTQTFPPTPGQWAQPTNGVVGLGSIQGTISNA